MSIRYKSEMSVSYGKGKEATKIVHIYNADTGEFIAHKVYDKNHVVFTYHWYGRTQIFRYI